MVAAEITALLSGGKQAARKFKRAQVLLAEDGGASDDEIARSVGVGWSTVYRTKRRFVFGNLKAAQRSVAPQAASSRARRKPCWSQQPVQAHPQDARAGHWSFWRVNWSGSPRTPASGEKPCGGAWPKTT
jgi:transposase